MIDESLTPSPDIYRISVKGKLDPEWADWFDGFEIEHQSTNETVLVGNIIDQAALHGLLAKIRDLGLSLLSVNQVEKDTR